MVNELLKECEKKKEIIQRMREKYSDDKDFQKYADYRETVIEAQEVIIKIICGIEGMTPKAAEKMLDNTKKLFYQVAMEQPIKQSTD